MYPTRTTFTTGTFHPSSRRPTPVAATHRTWATTPHPATAPSHPAADTARAAAAPHPTATPAAPGRSAAPEPVAASHPSGADARTSHPGRDTAPMAPAYPVAAGHSGRTAAPEPAAAGHPAGSEASASHPSRDTAPMAAAYPVAAGHPGRTAAPEPVAAGVPGRVAASDPVAASRPAGADASASRPARDTAPAVPPYPAVAGVPGRAVGPEPVAASHPARDAAPVAPAYPAAGHSGRVAVPEPVVAGHPVGADGPVSHPAPHHPGRWGVPEAVVVGRPAGPEEPHSARSASEPVFRGDPGPGAGEPYVAGPEPVVGRPAGPGEQHPVRAAQPEAVAAARPARAADPVAEPYAAHPADPEPCPVPAGPADGPALRQGRWVDAGWPPARGDVPAARAETETDTETGPETGPGPGAEPGVPHPAPQGTGVPGPGVAEIVAQAVARGMDAPRGDRGAGGDEDTLDIPLLRPPHGTAVTDVPVHLPFRAHHRPPEPPRDPRPAAPRRQAVRPPAGRRVPRGDDRLREHRGPVLPGWIAVIIGGLALSGCAAVLWRAGVVPAPLVAAFGAAPRPYRGLHAAHWPPLALLGIVALLALGGLGRARAGHAWVLTLFGRYRGTVRRTGLTWISPLLLRQRIDVRLRHWRSEPMPAVDSGGLALQVVVQVVWQVKDTARATLAVEDHTDYLAEQVESAMARVLSQLPADAFHEDAPTLRDAEAVGDALTRMLAAETEAVGIEVFSAQPTRIEYAPEVAEAMRRRRVAAIDAKHRDTVLTSVVDAVDDTVHRLTSRGIVELDDYERKALVKDLTVAFYTGRGDQ
ncbi:SPFH domain-containing protein [Streptomyces lavendulae]|uniref:SPFH domain-containing protein n=1 Tax=Streptomyces lavendulae TaxID=1914 RepID=UPI003683C141